MEDVKWQSRKPVFAMLCCNMSFYGAMRSSRGVKGPST